MSARISLIFWAWTAFSSLLFRVLPGRDAAIACLIAGWAFLPVEAYPPSATLDGGRSSSVHALAVPTSTQLNKATSIGLGCLAGLVLFDRKTSGRLRYQLGDLPMTLFCLVPLASGAANGIPLSEGLIQVRYLVLAWGVPYLMGRAYLVDDESRRRFVRGLVVAGLAYLPFCLLEWSLGPVVYQIAYGAHPYRFEGSSRLLGNRPLVFLEHGNQLGIWMASSALAATWSWADGSFKALGKLPGGVVASILVGATLLCQSLGSILLLAAGLIPLLASRRIAGRISGRTAIGLTLGLAALAVLTFAARQGFRPRAIGIEVVGFFKSINKSSFTWRMARSLDYLPVALGHPNLGWARPDWRPEGYGFLNPVNLSIWLLTLGMYGILGLSALVAAWLIPLAKFIRLDGGNPTGKNPGDGGRTLAALVAVQFLDGFSNAVVILPLLAAVGGLTASDDWRRSRTLR